MADRSHRGVFHFLRYCKPCRAWTDAGAREGVSKIDADVRESTACRFCGADLTTEPHMFSMHARGLVYASKSTPEWNRHVRALGGQWAVDG